MFTALENRLEQHGNWLLLLARLLMAIIFLHEASTLLVGFQAAAAAMSKIGVPAPALIATIALQLVAGLMLALGWYGRLGALALGLFCMMTAFLFHTNFASQNELLHFEKDLAIAGGMFVTAAVGTGAVSLDRFMPQRWRRRQGA